MQNHNYLFLVFLATILIIRLFLFLLPTSSPKIRNFKLHHYMYGVVITIASLLASNITLYGLGLGLLADEIPLFITNKWNWKGYDSLKSRLGVVIIIVIFFLLRKYILLPSLL